MFFRLGTEYVCDGQWLIEILYQYTKLKFNYSGQLFVGLFRAAIHESGTVLTSWGYQRYARDIAYKTAAALDSSITNDNSSADVLEVLQKVSARELQDAANSIPVCIE